MSFKDIINDNENKTMWGRINMLTIKDRVGRELLPHLRILSKVLLVGTMLNGGGTVSPSSK